MYFHITNRNDVVGVNETLHQGIFNIYTKAITQQIIQVEYESQ